MIVNRDDANEYYCVRTLALNLSDEDASPPEGMRCRGAACMAWRWATVTNGVKTEKSDELGYCGLADDPGPIDV